MSKYKGAGWFRRFCSAFEIPTEGKHEVPLEVLRQYEKRGYLWREFLFTYSTPRAVIALLTLDTTVSEGKPLAHWDPEEDNIYRVCIDPATQQVEVTTFGIDYLDTSEVGMYANTSTLPMWMQEKLAVLTMMSPKPPTTPVEGVGQRINATTYWLPKKENVDG